MKITARQIDFCNGAPAAARKTRDEPEKVVRVIHRERVAEAIKNGEDPERAIHDAVTAILYLRWTKSGVCHVVGLFVDSAKDGTEYDPDVAGVQVYYGSAGGYGYDKATAALRGMPVAMDGAKPVVLTDHCGLDLYGDENPYPGKREITVNSGGFGSSTNLPEFLFTL